MEETRIILSPIPRAARRRRLRNLVLSFLDACTMVLPTMVLFASIAYCGWEQRWLS